MGHQLWLHLVSHRHKYDEDCWSFDMQPIGGSNWREEIALLMSIAAISFEPFHLCRTHTFASFAC